MSARLSYLTAALLLPETARLEFARQDVGLSFPVYIPAGSYYILGQAPAVTSGANSDGVIGVVASPPHGLMPGDRLTVFRAGEVVARGLTCLPGTTATQIHHDGGSISVGDWGTVYAERDLLSTIWGRVCADEDLHQGFEIRVDRSTGVVRVTLLATEVWPSPTATIIWSGTDINGELVREWLRLSGVETELSLTPVYGSRAAAGVYAPRKPPSRDRPILQTLSSVSDPSTGGAQDVVFGATHRLCTIGLKFEGGPRASTWIEYHALEDLYRRMAQGAPVRWYRDSTVLTPFAPVENPFGWEEWVFDGPAPNWEPAEEFAGWVGRLRLEWLWREYVEDVGAWTPATTPVSTPDPLDAFTSLAALKSTLTQDGRTGRLVNMTTGLTIACFERRNGVIVPLGPWDLTRLTANRWARVASVTSSTEVEIEPGHNLSPSAFCRVADTSAGTATTSRSFTVTGTTLTLGTGYSSIAAGDLIYESGTSEIEFGLDVLVAADGASYNDAPAVYATGGGLHIEQAAVALLLPSEIDLTAPDACGFDVRIIGESSRQAAPVDADGGVVAFAVAGVMTRHSGTVRVNRAEYQWDDAASNTTLLRRYVNSSWPLEFSGAVSFAVSTMNAPPGDLLLGWQGVIGNLGTASTSQLGTMVRWNAVNAAQTSAVSGAPSANSLSTLLGMVTACAQRTARTSGTNYDPTLLVKSIDFGLFGF